MFIGNCTIKPVACLYLAQQKCVNYLFYLKNKTILFSKRPVSKKNTRKYSYSKKNAFNVIKDGRTNVKLKAQLWTETWHTKKYTRCIIIHNPKKIKQKPHTYSLSLILNSNILYRSSYNTDNRYTNKPTNIQ